MRDSTLTTFLLSVIAAALVVNVALQLPWFNDAVAQQPAQAPGAMAAPPAAAPQPGFRSVVIDRYPDVATAERSMTLRLLEGHEVISMHLRPESVGDPEADRNIRVSNLFVAPINSSFVVAYGRR